uniref:Uncharacterized protein n=1 Tax=Megaselia scalaris TaxID=36166 RepID=T1GJG9_MEGSC
MCGLYDDNTICSAYLYKNCGSENYVMSIHLQTWNQQNTPHAMFLTFPNIDSNHSIGYGNWDPENIKT